MACTSGSVEKVADKNVKAAEQIKKLEDNLSSQKDANERWFVNEIQLKLAEAKITDGLLLKESANMKVEYTSEFSIDRIAEVVVSLLNAAIAANNPTSPTPGMDKEAIQAYTMVVNSAAEASKSSSQSSSSFSFSMSRLCPGMYAFLLAKSTNILDEDTFGAEAVSATSIFCRVMRSIDDIKNEAKWGLAFLDAKNLLAMKALQLGLTDRLAHGDIDIDTWVELDSKYEGIIQNLKDRLAEHGWESTKEDQVEFAQLEPMINEAMVSITKLKTMSAGHQNIAKLMEGRIASSYDLRVF